MTALCSVGMGEGMGSLCSSATAGRVPPHMEGLSVDRQVQDCGLCIQSPPCGVRGGFDHPQRHPHTHRPLRIFRTGSLGK